jgi:hypothetical protein
MNLNITETALKGLNINNTHNNKEDNLDSVLDSNNFSQTPDSHRNNIFKKQINHKNNDNNENVQMVTEGDDNNLNESDPLYSSPDFRPKRTKNISIEANTNSYNGSNDLKVNNNYTHDIPKLNLKNINNNSNVNNFNNVKNVNGNNKNNSYDYNNDDIYEKIKRASYRATDETENDFENSDSNMKNNKKRGQKKESVLIIPIKKGQTKAFKDLFQNEHELLISKERLYNLPRGNVIFLIYLYYIK